MFGGAKKNFALHSAKNTMYIQRTKDKFDNLKGGDPIVMGIESSCDETAVAIVKGRRVLANIVASQIDIHRKYGGVVPEVASRSHTDVIIPCIDDALTHAGLGLDDIDCIGVTYGAGLIGALLVGVSAAKALALCKDIPLVKVDHIEGHICANYINTTLTPPFVSLVASGGHTAIYKVNGYNDHEILGATRDDAIGEAFDKVARMLGLPYPGGPQVDKLAKQGSPTIKFYKHDKGVNPDLSLSYSGLKTAVVNYIHNLRQRGEEPFAPDICASFTTEAVDLLVDTTLEATRRTGLKTIALAGGVAANSYLRNKLKVEGEKRGFEIVFPPLELCTDNAAMIAMRAYFSAVENKNYADMSLNARPKL